MKEFDYYIFIDYSENLIGYSIIESKKLIELLPKIMRFRHYRSAMNQKLYLKHIKDAIKRDDIKSSFLKLKIKEMHKNMDIYLDVLDFLKKHDKCILFISVDNSQYIPFRKMVNIVDGDNIIIKQESELIKGTPEYQASLVLDNLLNIERLKQNDK
ncbi:hypothetical protein COU57_03230 [Candidatus Pacearchaeota archaeon CG10_big_fil_rev_8_21_14_0_10_32_14]|nr:MAG: hypothetical protein COU57_03230 [Candidatus Pacearchaeota archaeon CG10_big_fil_rev_8_21_14_0_10_32_14]